MREQSRAFLDIAIRSRFDRRVHITDRNTDERTRESPAYDLKRRSVSANRALRQFDLVRNTVCFGRVDETLKHLAVEVWSVGNRWPAVEAKPFVRRDAGE